VAASDWLIDAAIGRPRAQDTLARLSDEGLAVGIIAVAEVYEGAFGTPDSQATLAGLRLHQPSRSNLHPYREQGVSELCLDDASVPGG
jgi:hypothetical protein